jgi:hypothetical protein
MENRKILGVLSLVGIFITASSASLLAISAANYNNNPILSQYAEFWVVARSGGGLGTANYSDLYVKCFPLSASPDDLRVADLSFNISASQSSSFIPLVQFLAVLSAPNCPAFATSWLDHLSQTMSDQATLQLLNEGLATPHNLTVCYVEMILHIFANNTVYTFSLGRNPYSTVTERNETARLGLIDDGSWELDYHPNGTFTYYVPPQDRNIVLDLGFNSGGNLSFSLQASWNVSFEQKYGPCLKYAGNATIANWLFKKLDDNTIRVSIDLNNTNYHPPVPAFAVIPWSPVLETGVLVAGLIVTVVGLVLWKKYCRKADVNSDQKAMDR